MSVTQSFNGATGTRDLIMNLERYFGMTRESLLCQPVPELGYAVDWVVVFVGSDEDIRVQEVEHD